MDGFYDQRTPTGSLLRSALAEVQRQVDETPPPAPGQVSLLAYGVYDATGIEVGGAVLYRTESGSDWALTAAVRRAASPVISGGHPYSVAVRLKGRL